MDGYIDREIKEVQVKTQAEEETANWKFQPTHDGHLQKEMQPPQPFEAGDSRLKDLDPVQIGEQPGNVEPPQAGVEKKVDPAQAVEEDIIRRQQYNLYRDRYRRAVQREFLRRAHDDGVEPNRNLAEELKDMESRY